MASWKSLRDKAEESHEARQRRFGGGVAKLATGGKVEGRASGGGRLDRKAGGKSGKKGTTVNIILGGAGQQQPQVRPVPVPVRAPMPGAGGPPSGMMPPRPPVAGMGPGGPPPGGMPPGMPPPGAGGGLPPGMMPPRKRGGSVKMTAGAASGEGRIQKERMVE